jgi:hypothetical protein
MRSKQGGILMNVKRSLIIGATVATVSMAGVGVASAATSSMGTGGDTLAQKIATKFGLNASDVQSVIDQNRQDNATQREANFKTNLATAVKYVFAGNHNGRGMGHTPKSSDSSSSSTSN